MISARSDHQILRLNLELPDRPFMEVIEQWLASNAGGRKFGESYWLADPTADEDASAA